MMIVSAPRPTDIQQKHRERRLEIAMWAILSLQFLQWLVLLLLVRRG
jgi:hypothetical protein